MPKASKLKQAFEKAKSSQVDIPLWKGPEVDGVTSSLLTKFLTCRERFRQLVVYGRKSAEVGFNHRLEYGNLWHLAEETHATNGDWEEALDKQCALYFSQYPLERADAYKWTQICKMQYKVYLDHRAKFVPKNHKLLEAEQPFDFVYTLPSGDKVLLRGKRDALFTDQYKALWLQENKTKGDVDQLAIQRDLQFDLQTMLYCTVASMQYPKQAKNGINVMYNVVKRPLSGGVGTIRQRKPSKSNPAGETDQEYLNRLREVLEELADEHFLRFDVTITPNDLRKFITILLDPILQSLCDWWKWVVADPEHPYRKGNTLHWRTPYLVNSVFEGYYDGLSMYLDKQIQTNTQQVKNLYPEL